MLFEAEVIPSKNVVTFKLEIYKYRVFLSLFVVKYRVFLSLFVVLL